MFSWKLTKKKKKMKSITEASIRSRVSLEAAIANQREAFLALHRGEVVVPERLVVDCPPHGATLFKPFSMGSSLGLKVVSVRSTGVPGVLLLFDPVSGHPSALMSATHLTGLRTAAGSALAASLLAPPRPSHLTVFGAGLQAELHAAALLSVLPTIDSISLVGRSPAPLEALVARLRAFFPASVRVASVASSDAKGVSDAVAMADVVVTATPSREALFDGRLLKRGVLVCAVGSFSPTMRELDAACMERATCAADDPTAVMRTAGEFVGGPTRVACSLGALLEDETMAQRVFGEADVRVYKSVGNAAQDLFIARLAMEMCAETASVIEL